ncbi:ecotropic viral integration site 5 ortholog [Parambassis ranga]|uniref:Ecotropic viral integration site 5 ortholog n=1 Tax=Parambassis ranga TaxID=210632 RepID=A0A6P7J792_9TELE|nr:ecotropic viral integration site 5 ortholog-like [Parambassis ranga]
MLKLSSLAEKSLSDEDSSGSDAGSEVSLEPETDRFGFILTNGSTSGTVGPSPELVRQREAKWINIISHWDRILLKKTSKIKMQCQKGIPASLRAKGWPFLCGAADRMKQNKHLYESLDSQPGLQSWVDVIERDLDRQFPFHEMFLSKDGHGQRGLFRVLKAYTQYQPEEGYCQAQGPVAAVLLMNMPAEEAFWCLVQISEEYLPGYYSPLLEGVLFDAAMLTWVLKKTCPPAHKHLQQHGVEPLMFATDWLMCLFTRHLPFNTLLRVWDLFFCYGVRVLLQVAVVLVRRVLGRPEQRKLCQGQMETLERLRGVREEVQEEDDTFITEVCSVPLSTKDLKKRTEKELEKWRKDRPSSTFDPRGRCHGCRMACERARQREEAREKKEREKGNLAVPLTRSASTLSLSPSLLHKKWRKGGKVTTGDGEKSNKVVRHLSMGAKDDWRSWADLNFKNVQGVQEEEEGVGSDGHKPKNESKLTRKTEQKKCLQEPENTNKTENIPTEHKEESVTIKEQVENVEKEEAELQETEESKMLSETNSATAENILHSTEHKSHHIQEEKEDIMGQSQVLQEQSDKNNKQETSAEHTNEDTEKHEAENDHTAAAEEQPTDILRDANTMVETRVGVDKSVQQVVQADMKPEESTEPENVQQVDEVTGASETRTEKNQDSGNDRDVEASTVKDPTTTAEVILQQAQEEEITDPDDAIQETYHSTESLVETKERDGSHTQTETETDVLAQTQETGEENAATQDKVKADITQTHPEKETQTDEETISLFSSECIQQVTDTKTGDTLKQSTNKILSEPTQEQEELILTVHPDTEKNNEATWDKLMADITQMHPEKETQTDEETLSLLSPACTQQVTDMVMDRLKQSTSEILCQPTQEQEETNLNVHPETEWDNAATQDEVTVDIREKETEEETVSLFSPECIQQVTNTEPDAEVPTEEDKSKALPEPTQENEEIILTVHTETQEETVTCICDETHADETPTKTQVKEEMTDSVTATEKEETSPQTEAQNAHPDGQQIDTSDEHKPSQRPTSQATAGPVQEEESTENVKENTTGQDDVFISAEQTDNQLNDSNSQVQGHFTQNQSEPLIQTSSNRSSRSSGDFCVRKSSSSRGSRLARRLSEDLFTTPQKTVQSQSNPGAVNTTHSAPVVCGPTEMISTPCAEVTEDATGQQEQRHQQADPVKRFGLFRKLKGEHPKNTKAKGKPKMQVPKILIQDFSDETGTGIPIEEKTEEKLSSRERRRRRREQERREKEEERLKRKREKEMEKERDRERRKPQTRGKSFQVQKVKGSDDIAHPGKTLRYSSSYAESYF